MKLGYGTYVTGGVAGAAALREEVRGVEAAGFDGVFFSEHRGFQGFPADPLGAAIFCLGETTSLRAGPMPMLLPLYDPVRVAERASQANFLSGGRMVLGLGAGYREADFAQVGIPLNERGARMDEALEVLTYAWAGEGGDYDGRFYKLHQREPLPHRAQDPPEVWMCSWGRPGMRRAIRTGAGLMLSGMFSGAEIRATVDVYRDLCRQAGAEVGRIGCMRRCWLGGKVEVEGFLDRFVDQMENSVSFERHAEQDWVRALRDPSRPWAGDVVMAGEPEEVAERLSEWARELGIEYVILKLHWGQADDFELLPEQLKRAERLCRRVASMSSNVAV